MSSVGIAAALETALATVTPALATAWENMPYKNADGTPAVPTVGVPYQAVHVLPADTENPEMSQRLTRKRGIMQVSLKYPLDTGAGAARARADLIEAAFYAGRSFTSGSVRVTVDGTPSVLPGFNETDRYVLPVRIRFYSHITRS